MKGAILACRDQEALARELRRIVDAILAGEVKTEADLESRKKDASSRLRLPSLPSNADILGAARPEERARLQMLVRKPTRTLSGVAVIAAMTSPARCPHGTCVPCPGGISCTSPQSYTGREPAALRAAQHNFGPYEQTAARLAQLYEIGHSLDKSELIIMGGTITSRPLGYQHWFIKRCLQAMNDFPIVVAGSRKWQSFSDVAVANETALARNVGTTFETRPDWCGPKDIENMLLLGATKVELGVQSTRDDLLRAMSRGHTVEDSVRANRDLREAGLKVGFHMMPGLPGSSPEKDLEVFSELFSDSRFRPDYLKIYPTLVVEGTELFRRYQSGEYKPLGDGEAARLVSRIKAMLPAYVRLQRVQRDIPAHLIVAGVKKSNLRQLARQDLLSHGGSCRCIRCREAGLRGIVEVDVSLKHEVYDACGGEEHFLSIEGEDDTLVGFLRLRLGSGSCARARELHVYGPMVPIGTRKDGWQHRGYGAKLVETAEALAADEGYDRLEITSGIGARGYYRRLGYELVGPYMGKSLK
ncbi:MAG: tRNA uridine(34) 5-carboxymethylaminomethyl modification radical SAM/GNAT enzyme Elp3 [Methanothrix sp.]|nr:MAG: tRNA uridine(34) 5-carboxymethylaminomethyl modification radical SAM/GNAT enzyme Elp3 [Methanothrix sp.]